MSITSNASDFDAVMAEVEILATTIDPSRTPFQSKYLAVDRLVRETPVKMSSRTLNTLCHFLVSCSGFISLISYSNPHSLFIERTGHPTKLSTSIQRRRCHSTRDTSISSLFPPLFLYLMLRFMHFHSSPSTKSYLKCATRLESFILRQRRQTLQWMLFNRFYHFNMSILPLIGLLPTYTIS